MNSSIWKGGLSLLENIKGRGQRLLDIKGLSFIWKGNLNLLEDIWKCLVLLKLLK